LHIAVSFFVESASATRTATCRTEEGKTWFVLGAEKGAASGE